MTYLLCRNRVADFAHWKAVFASHAEAHQRAGLQLTNVWRTAEQPTNVFFMFRVASIDKAREFISDPKAAKAGDLSGVLDGEYHFVEETKGY